MLALASAGPAWGRVLVDVSHVGIPAAGSSNLEVRRGDVIRCGAWTPVIVDISIEGQPAFDGVLRIAQLDNDGDQCYDAVEVHLLLESGGTQRYYLYVPANPDRGRSQFSLELLDSDGQVVEVVNNGEMTTRPIPPQPPQAISDDHLLILEVSSGTIGRVLDLAQPDQSGMYARPVVVGHLSPKDLPELWIGLEMVDCMIWEGARPEELTPAQLGAVLDWVRAGGTLLITASRSAGSILMSQPLNKVLPVTLGDIATTTDLPDLRRKLLQSRSESPYAKEIPFVRARVRKGARIILHEESVGDVLTSRRLGRGRLIFSAVTLSDMFSGDGSPIQFFRKILHLKTQGEDEAQATPISLFPYVTSAVGFAVAGSVYLLIAVLFSVTYVGLATFGSWSFLGRKGLRHYSWGVFGLAVSAATVLSVIAVKAVLGIETKLHQISIVDAVAGETYGHATAFFGIKTPTDTRLDLWLPSDYLSEQEPGKTRCHLRPTSVGLTLEDAASFADPVEYRLVPASAVIEEVRVRATLKRLEGRWQGPLGGRFTAEVAVIRHGDGPHDRRLAESSYVINELGADLRGCYLIHSVYDLFSATAPYFEDRADTIYVFPIGDIPSNGEKVPLYDRCYSPPAERPNQPVYDVMRSHTLAGIQDDDWSTSFLSILRAYDFLRDDQTRVTPGKEQEALLLLSTMGEYNPLRGASERDLMIGLKTFSRDRLRQLDLREQLGRDCVYLIGFAEDPGPVRLAMRKSGRAVYHTLSPEEGHSWTMYRIRIPVRTGEDGEAEDGEGDKKG